MHTSDADTRALQTLCVDSSLSTQCQDNVTGCGIMSSVWDMILQWGSTIKLSIELPVATRHRRDMTEKLLKATLNPNSHTHSSLWLELSKEEQILHALL